MVSFPNRLKLWDKKHGKAYQKNATQLTQTVPDKIGMWHMPYFDSCSCITQLGPIKKVTEPPKRPTLHMHKDEDLLFLKLATATKIYTQYELSNDDITRAKNLIQEYLLGFKKVLALLYTLFSLILIIADVWCFKNEAEPPLSSPSTCANAYIRSCLWVLVLYG